MGFRDAFPLRDAFPSAVTPLHSTGLHRIYTQNIWVCTATTFNYRSLLQNIICFIGLFCKIYGYAQPLHSTGLHTTDMGMHNGISLTHFMIMWCILHSYTHNDIPVTLIHSYMHHDIPVTLIWISWDYVAQTHYVRYYMGWLRLVGCLEL